MRRIALLGLVLLLPACGSAGDYVGNPFDGFGRFLGDSITINANRPIAEGANVRRVIGEPTDVEPLLPEAGNIWPAPPRPDPSLADIQRELGTEQRTGASTITPPMRGSSTPPTSLQPVAPPSASTTPPSVATPAPVIPQSAPLLQAGTSVSTPKGPAIITNGGNGVQTYTLPNGASGRAINNGNGTMTLIGGDGTVLSVPTPR